MKKIGPQDIYDHISDVVVGQEAAKKTIANAVFLHYVRYVQSFTYGKDVKKSNTLLMGPSGNGKTHIVRAAANALRELTGYSIAPVLEVDCTTLSARGWEGDDLVDLLEKHYKEHRDNEAEFNSSIIFLDEVDKLCMPAISRGGSDHNKNTQYGLLKMVEGCEVTLPTSKRKIDTSKMMFIFAGNFSQIRHALKDAQKPAMGFTSGTKGGDTFDLHKQLEMGGMVTQLAGRISTVGVLEKLTKKELREILNRFVIPEFQETWDFLGYDLNISDYYRKKIVDEAYAKGTGARGLQSAVDNFLSGDLFTMKFEW